MSPITKEFLTSLWQYILIMAAVFAALYFLGGEAHADFTQTLTTSDFGTVDDGSGAAITGSPVHYFGQTGSMSGFVPVAVFDATGTPTNLTGATLAWGDSGGGPTVSGLEVLAFVRTDGSLFGYLDGNPQITLTPTTDLGSLDSTGTVDATAFLQEQVAAGHDFVAFLVLAGAGEAGFLGQPTLRLTAPETWTAAPPLGGPPPAVPEPHSLLLLGLGAAYAALRRRHAGGKPLD